jgi:hypothetical protein
MQISFSPLACITVTRTTWALSKVYSESGLVGGVTAVRSNTLVGVR